MKPLIRMAERRRLPDWLIRLGIRGLDYRRLAALNRGGPRQRAARKRAVIRRMRSGPIAAQTDRANEQHYEVPVEFFRYVLGSRMKYSACHWPGRVDSLDAAEESALALVGRRARLADGQRVLELGCGWGAFSLWAAERFPSNRITAVSNAASQRRYIEAQCRKRGIANLSVVTADMNRFETDERYDRIVSVEMFEHMRNWERLLERISGWLTPGGRLFVHIFSHRSMPYFFEAGNSSDWMGRHFFTGGLMPSDDLMYHFKKDLIVERHWRLDGTHYRKTANGWLTNLDTREADVLPVMAGTYGATDAAVWLQRWRIFFMACAELWGLRNGTEWLVSHYLMKHPAA